jgi:hypothetical protein
MAAELRRLDSIKALVEGEYPLPIAAVFRRVRTTRQEDLGGRSKGLFDLVEVFLKLICMVALQEARLHTPHLRDLLPQKEKTLEFLRHPSLGGWLGLLRVLVTLREPTATARFLPAVTEWLQRPPDAEGRALLAALQERLDTPTLGRVASASAELCALVVQYRNRHAHGGGVDGAALRTLEAAIVYLLDGARFLRQLPLVYADRVELGRDNRWLVHALRLSGLGEEPEQIETAIRPERSEVYLWGPEGSTPVPLAPFVLWQPDPATGRGDVFLYNGAGRTKLDYVAHATGTFYYHRELHRSLEELLSLRLHAETEDDPNRQLSPEQRSAAAENHRKLALFHLGQGRLEDAVEELEHATGYERRAETFLELARAQAALGDPPEAVLHSLEQCLDLEPAHAEAHRLRVEVLQAEGGWPAQPVVEPNATAPDLTFFEALTPARLRGFASAWWSGLVLAWYSISAGLSLAWGRSEEVLANALQCVFVLAVVAMGVQGPRRLRGLQDSLALQLHALRLDRFRQMFDEHMLRICGRFVLRDGRLDLGATVSGEPRYHAGFLAWLMALVGSCLVLTRSFDSPAWLLAKRTLDYGLLMMVVFPVARYALGTAAFVHRFADLSLKPMLSRMSDDGIRSFASLQTLHSSLVLIAYPAYWALAALVVTGSVPLDLFFLAVTTLLASSATVFVPLQLRRALRLARARLVQTYSSHIDQALREFLETPVEANRERYAWLLQNQSLLERIPVWPLSWPQTLYSVVASNLVILGVDVWYTLRRLGVPWRTLLPW